MSNASDIAASVGPLVAAEHMLGDRRSALTLLQYGDYECPACIREEPLTQALVEAFGQRMRFVWRHFPLVELHPHAELAAEATEAAAAQGQFWAMHRRLFSPPKHLAPEALALHAQAIGLDMNRYRAEMGDRIYTQRIQEHRLAAERDGVQRTPAFILNGEAVDVAHLHERVEEAIQSALHAAAHLKPKAH